MTESSINDNVEDKSTTAVVSSTTSSNSNAIVFGSKYKHNLRSTISYEKVPSKYNDIIDLILSPDLEIVSSLCSTTLVRETVPNTVHISEYLILFFEYHCNLKSSYILKWAIDREIDNTSNSATLFRGLSTATRLISAFYKRVGESYLKYLLQPFVVDLCSRNFSFEIDPEKAGKGVNIQTNLEKLITITQQLLDKILDSVDQCPLPIRQILNHTQEKVEKRFKSMKTTVVGGFIFLRFICPAIVAPEAFGLIPKDEEPTSETRRSLVLVSKLLQNLANEMPFGSGIKEEYMTFLNDFISSNSSRIHIFFDNLAQDPTVNNTSINTSSNSLIGGNVNGNGSSSSSTTTTPSLSSIQKTNATSANASGSVFDSLQLDGSNNNNNNNSNTNNTPTNVTPSKPSEDLNNLNVLINQIIENREKIENYILDENNYPSNVSSEIIKRLDSSLHAVKQKNIFKSLGLPWMRGKEGNNKESNSNGGNNKESSTNNGGTGTVNGKLKKSPSSNNVVSNSSHIQQLQQQVEKEKQSSSDKKQTVQLSQSQQLLENTITNGNRSLSKNNQFSQSYAQIDELSEMKDQREIDNTNLMVENTRLKKELEEAKMRNNLIKRLRDELDREKTEKKELKALVKRCNDRLKSLDPEFDLINDLGPWCDDGPSVGSNTDLQSIIEETLGVGGSSSGMNGGKRKSNSALGISKVKQSSDQLNTPSSAHSLSSSTTNVPLIINTPPIANAAANTNITSSTTTTPSILNDINSTSSLQPSPQPQSINHSTNYIPHLDVSCDSNNSTASSAGNVNGNATAINTNNNVINNNLNIIKKSSTNASISDIISEADEHTSKTGSNISIGSHNNSIQQQQLASSNNNNNNSNTNGGSSVVGGTSIKSSSNSTVNNSRRNSTTSEISNINDTTIDPSNYEKQNQLIQTVVEGGEIQDDSACDLLEFLKEVANRKQELQATKEKQKQEEKEQKQKASIFFKFSKLGSSKKKKSSNSPILTSTPSSRNMKLDENKDNNPSSAGVMNI